MNLEQLKRLVAVGESDRLEFKKTTGDLKGGMETLCGFLNFGLVDSSGHGRGACWCLRKPAEPSR